MKKTKYSLIGISISVLLAGCATPQSVKSLSAEQVKIQEETKSSLEQYFGIVEELVSNQVTSFKRQEDADLAKEIEIYLKRYHLDSSKAGANVDALSKELAEKIRKATEDSIQTKKSYELRLSDLKEKHKEVLLVFDTLTKSQKTLDNYIQLKKADEALASLLYSRLGVNESTITSYTNSISEIVNFQK